MKRVILIAAMLAVTGCGKDAYHGFYYPDANNLYKDVTSPGTFETLDECRRWVFAQRESYNPNGGRSDDYECGLNCDLSTGKPYICEETMR